MCNILGGGGGKSGFKHLMEHLGPATRAWTKYVNADAFQLSAESTAKLDESVQEWPGHIDMQEVEKERDTGLIDLVKLKRENPALT